MDTSAFTLVNEPVLPFLDCACPSLYKIYHDGGHYIASHSGKAAHRHAPHAVRTELDSFFAHLYKAAMLENLRGEALFRYVRSGFDGVVTDIELDEYVTRMIKREQHNLFLRKKRFRRKAFLNRWNYFVTFTYDDDKHTEDTFRKKLRTCLSHLHTRRGWKYMGVFERAPDTGRLHFHGIFFVPAGEMLGKITEKKDYSTAQKKMQTRHENDFFEGRFGRNDFSELNDMEMYNGQTLNYILKYIAKTGERIVYSRGIPSELYGNVNDNDIVTEMRDYGTKYVLFDDTFCLSDITGLSIKSGSYLRRSALLS